MVVGVNLTKVYWKHIWKCHNETPVLLSSTNKNVLKSGKRGQERNRR
jgi:hypothetical protein